jgi:hypothetical protein
MSASEILGWRDGWLSERHRLWGTDAPATDIDFLLIEFDHGKAVALIDYKYVEAQSASRSRAQRMSSFSILALADLGDRAGLPVFVVEYGVDNVSHWRVVPINSIAIRELLRPEESEWVSEIEYVEWLYRIRGREMPEWLHENLNRNRKCNRPGCPSLRHADRTTIRSPKPMTRRD